MVASILDIYTKLPDVLPGFVRLCQFNSIRMNTETLRKGCAGLVPSWRSDKQHYFGCQLRASNSLAFGLSIGASHIVDVISLRSYHKVIRIAARSVVALMSNNQASRNRPVGKHIGKYMSSRVIGVRIFPDNSVASGRDKARPGPALVRSANRHASPKSFFQRSFIFKPFPLARSTAKPRRLFSVTPNLKLHTAGGAFDRNTSITTCQRAGMRAKGAAAYSVGEPRELFSALWAGFGKIGFGHGLLQSSCGLGPLRFSRI